MFEVIILVVGLTIGAGPEKTNAFIDSSIKTVKETTETVIQKTKFNLNFLGNFFLSKKKLFLLVFIKNLFNP